MTPPQPITCEHTFVHGGVKFEYGGRMPGSSAEWVIYYDWFFCTKCLESQYKRLSPYPGDHDSYQAIRYGATPK